jgi:translation initiation factor IF-2
MANLRKTQKQISTTLIAMGLLSLAAAVVLFLPLAGSADSRRAELTQLSNELRIKTREAVPLRDFPKKIVEARTEIKDFYDVRFPAVESAVSESLGKVAAEQSVKIDTAKYDSKADDRNEKSETKEAQAVGLRRVQIEASFSGSYPNMMRFVNELEKARTFFLVDSVNVGEAQGGDVKLQMKLEAFVKAAAQ